MLTITQYPDTDAVTAAMASDEPLLMVITFDGEYAIVAPADDAVEHHVLLSKYGISSSDIGRYFHIVFDKEGADWTFICPADYRNISDKRRRIEQFYHDGFTVISAALAELGYLTGIHIPRRYRRHLDELKEM